MRFARWIGGNLGGRRGGGKTICLVEAYSYPSYRIYGPLRSGVLAAYGRALVHDQVRRRLIRALEGLDLTAVVGMCVGGF